MRGKFGDTARLKHMMDAIGEIETYLVNADFDTFMNNSMMRFACIKQMEIIGETSDHISEEIKTKFSEIELAQIKGMRNIFGHEYFGIDSRLVWEIIKHDLPDLKNKVATILKTLT
ncbi:MAG: DUF86 domain-containing protein [Bacteroidetes bacterium]|nr:DUF86 domain-containing protein [Bacteroidota bacterium]